VRPIDVLDALSGFGSSAAPATGPLQNLVSPSFANPLVLLIVSMVIGALFGYASDQVAKVLPTKLPTRAAHA
jgi:tetrahydromethanopterin S-methyltransferase subunit C